MFTKKKFHPKNFHPKKFSPKNFHPKNFHQKNFHPKKFSPKNFHSNCHTFLCRPEMSTVVRQSSYHCHHNDHHYDHDKHCHHHHYPQERPLGSPTITASDQRARSHSGEAKVKTSFFGISFILGFLVLPAKPTMH